MIHVSASCISIIGISNFEFLPVMGLFDVGYIWEVGVYCKLELDLGPLGRNWSQILPIGFE